MASYRWYDGQRIYDTLDDLKEIKTQEAPPFKGTIAIVTSPGYNCPVSSNWELFDRGFQSKRIEEAQGGGASVEANLCDQIKAWDYEKILQEIFRQEETSSLGFGGYEESDPGAGGKTRSMAMENWAAQPSEKQIRAVYSKHLEYMDGDRTWSPTLFDIKYIIAPMMMRSLGKEDEDLDLSDLYKKLIESLLKSTYSEVGERYDCLNAALDSGRFTAMQSFRDGFITKSVEVQAGGWVDYAMYTQGAQQTSENGYYGNAESQAFQAEATYGQVASQTSEDDWKNQAQQAQQDSAPQTKIEEQQLGPIISCLSAGGEVLLPWVMDTEGKGQPIGWVVNPEIPGAMGIDRPLGEGTVHPMGRETTYIFTSRINVDPMLFPIPDELNRYLKTEEKVQGPVAISYAYIQGQWALYSDRDPKSKGLVLDKPEENQQDDLTLEYSVDGNDWIEVINHPADDNEQPAVRMRRGENPWRVHGVVIDSDEEFYIRFVQKSFNRGSHRVSDEWSIDDVIVCGLGGDGESAEVKQGEPRSGEGTKEDCLEYCGPGTGIGVYVWIPTMRLEDAWIELQGGSCHDVSFSEEQEDAIGIGRFVVRPNDRQGGTTNNPESNGGPGDTGRWVSVIPSALWKRLLGPERLETHVMSHQDCLAVCDGPPISNSAGGEYYGEKAFDTFDGFDTLLLKPTPLRHDGYGIYGGVWLPKLGNEGDEVEIHVTAAINAWGAGVYEFETDTTPAVVIMVLDSYDSNGDGIPDGDGWNGTVLRLKNVETNELVDGEITLLDGATGEIMFTSLQPETKYRLWCQEEGNWSYEIGMEIKDQDSGSVLLNIPFGSITEADLAPGHDVNNSGGNGGGNDGPPEITGEGLTLRVYCGTGIEAYSNTEVMIQNSELLGEVEADMTGIVIPAGQTKELGLNLKLKAIPWDYPEGMPPEAIEQCDSLWKQIEDAKAQCQATEALLAELYVTYHENDCNGEGDPELCAQIQGQITEAQAELEGLNEHISQLTYGYSNSCQQDGGWTARESTITGSRALRGIIPVSPYPTRLGPANDKWHCFRNSQHLSNWFSSAHVTNPGGDGWACDKSIFVTWQWGTSGDNMGWQPNPDAGYNIALTQFNMNVQVPVCSEQLLDSGKECNPMGCTDQDACNYNENATIDDGSCMFEDCFGECGGDAVDLGCGCGEPAPTYVCDNSSELVCEECDCPPPTAFNHSAGMNEDESYTATITGSGHNAGWTVSSYPTSGSVTLDSDTGEFTYVPNEEFSGNDSFVAKITDSCGRTAYADVNIIVTPVNDPPIAIIGHDMEDGDGGGGSNNITITNIEAVNLELNASASYDVDNSPGDLTYRWTSAIAPGSSCTSDDTCQEGYYCDMGTCQPIVLSEGITFKPWSSVDASQIGPGSYTYFLVASDPQTDSAADSITIIVLPNLGCTETSACNYNENANVDDGTCEFAGECYDCFGNCICEEDCFGECGGAAVEDDCGECNGDNSTCSGCTDDTACNYDPSATIDDGSCQYADWECWDGSFVCEETLCPPAVFCLGAEWDAEQGQEGALGLTFKWPEEPEIVGFQIGLDAGAGFNLRNVFGGAAGEAGFNISHSGGGTIVAFSNAGSSIRGSDCNGTPLIYLDFIGELGPNFVNNVYVQFLVSDPLFIVNYQDNTNGGVVQLDLGCCENDRATNDPRKSGCDNVKGSGTTYDDCGICRDLKDPDWNSTCLDCNDVPGGTAEIDDCGDCWENGRENANWNSKDEGCGCGNGAKIASGKNKGCCPDEAVNNVGCGCDESGNAISKKQNGCCPGVAKGDCDCDESGQRVDVDADNCCPDGKGPDGEEKDCADECGGPKKSDECNDCEDPASNDWVSVSTNFSLGAPCDCDPVVNWDECENCPSDDNYQAPKAYPAINPTDGPCCPGDPGYGNLKPQKQENIGKPCNCAGDVWDCRGICGGGAIDEGCGCGNGPVNAETGCCDKGPRKNKGPNGEAPDCAGKCGGSATEDDCSNCSDISEGDDGWNDCWDCEGTAHGTATDEGCGCGNGPVNAETGCCDKGPNKGKGPNGEKADCTGKCGGTTEPDCNDDCGGSAFIDDCDECVGGKTGKLANWKHGDCGTCDGANVDQDGCCPNGKTPEGDPCPDPDLVTSDPCDNVVCMHPKYCVDGQCVQDGGDDGHGLPGDTDGWSGVESLP